jgi:hypothetical protein
MLCGWGARAIVHTMTNVGECTVYGVFTRPRVLSREGRAPDPRQMPHARPARRTTSWSSQTLLADCPYSGVRLLCRMERRVRLLLSCLTSTTRSLHSLEKNLLIFARTKMDLGFGYKFTLPPLRRWRIVDKCQLEFLPWYNKTPACP